MIYAMPFYTNIKFKEGTEQYLNTMSRDWVKEANSRLKELRVICGNVGFKFLSNMYGRVIMETQSWMDGYTCRRCGRCFSNMLNTSVLNALGEGGYMDASQDSVAFKTGRTPAFIEYKAFVTPNRHITENELRERGWSKEDPYLANSMIRINQELHADPDRTD